MYTLSPEEMKALELIKQLDKRSEDVNLVRQGIQDIINQLWKLKLPSGGLLEGFADTLYSVLHLARGKREFFAFIGYDLEIILKHYELVYSIETKNEGW